MRITENNTTVTGSVNDAGKWTILQILSLMLRKSHKSSNSSSSRKFLSNTHLHRFPPQDHEVFCAHHHEPREFVTQQLLDLIRLKLKNAKLLDTKWKRKVISVDITNSAKVGSHITRNIAKIEEIVLFNFLCRSLRSHFITQDFFPLPPSKRDA